MSDQSEGYDALGVLLTGINNNTRKDLEGHIFRIGLLRDLIYGVQHAYTSGVGGGGASELTDLSDVDTAAITNRYVLVANGSEYEGRLLVEADVSDLGTYLTAEVNDLTDAVTWANVPDANITEGSVTQHEAALTITESQISDLDHDDTDAVHDNVAGEIAAVTTKGTPVTGDYILIEDSAAANVKKKITIGTLPFTASGHAHAASDITSGTFANARISASSVTQHEASLSIGNGNWDSSDLAVANGGTGSSSASAARTALGLAIGTDVQAFDAQLTDVAGLAVTANNFMMADGANWTLVAPAAVKTALSLSNVENTALSTWAGTSNIVTVGTITTGVWTGTAVAVANGGTGSTSAGSARTALGVPALAHTHVYTDIPPRSTVSYAGGPATHAAVISDQFAKVDSSTGAILIQLPAASGNDGLTYTVFAENVGGGDISVEGNSGTENINGATTSIVVGGTTLKYDSMICYCDGTEWWIIGGVNA